MNKSRVSGFYSILFLGLLVLFLGFSALFDLNSSYRSCHLASFFLLPTEPVLVLLPSCRITTTVSPRRHDHSIQTSLTPRPSSAGPPSYPHVRSHVFYCRTTLTGTYTPQHTAVSSFRICKALFVAIDAFLHPQQPSPQPCFPTARSRSFYYI